MRKLVASLCLALLLHPAVSLAAYSGNGGVWATKSGDFVSRNFPGTQTGVDAAITYCGNAGFVQISSGLEGVAPTSIPSGVTVVRADSSGWTVLSQAVYLANATPDLNGTTDPKLYSDKTLDLSTATSAQADKNVDIVTRYTNTTAHTNLSLNGLHAINRYGVSGSGGGDVNNGIALGGYSEYRGNSTITGSLYGGEFATTMYNSGTTNQLFGSLSTAQVTTGATATVTALRGAQGLARVHGTGAGTVTDAIGVEGAAGFYDTSSGTITNAIGGRFSAVKAGGATGTIAAAYGVYIPAVTQGGTNNFGLRILGASGGSGNNKSIYVDDGDVFFADSLTSNGGGRVAGGMSLGFANTGTTAGTLVIDGGNSGVTSQQIIFRRNGSTDMAIQANSGEHIRFNHNLSFGTTAGTTFAVLDGQGQLRLGDGAVPTHDLETVGSATIGDSLRVAGVADFNSNIVQFKGVDVASTAAMTLGVGNVFTITGTADITSITARPAGTTVVLIFSGNAATNGIVDGSNLVLASTMLYTANDTMTLVSDGTNWIETARSVN